MAYVTLARQHRPQRFEDVSGQRHVTRTLQNALRLGRIGQAYLFTGPRGVGKTTVARILAKALNCVEGPTPEPCGECDACRRTTTGSSLSVIEIDAASHRSIDDIRALREDVQFAPTDGRRKVYILDEAHQITGPAFEAFLKTLEEPPPHVVFVLATTEPQKIPATILSRCQRFDFRRVPVTEIVERLDEVCRREAIDAEPAALQAIARAADGGLRDALSVLDQLIAYTGEHVTADAVEAVLGTLGTEQRLNVTDHLLDAAVREALAWLQALLDAGHDAKLLIDELIAHTRLLLLARLECAGDQLSTLPEDLRQRVTDQAHRFEPDRLMAAVETLAQADKAMRWHPQPRLLLEVALIDLSLDRRPTAVPAAAQAPAQARPATSHAPPPEPERPRAEGPDGVPELGPWRGEPPRRERAAEVEERPRPSERSRPRDAAPSRAASPTGEDAPVAPLADDETLTVAAVRARLPQLMTLLSEAFPPLMAHLVHAEVLEVHGRDQGSEVVFGFRGWAASYDLCEQPEQKRVLNTMLQKVLGRPAVFRGKLLDEAASPVADGPNLDEAVAWALDLFPGAEPIDG